MKQLNNKLTFIFLLHFLEGSFSTWHSLWLLLEQYKKNFLKVFVLARGIFLYNLDFKLNTDSWFNSKQFHYLLNNIK